MSTPSEVFESLGAALNIAVLLPLSPLLRQGYNHEGTTPAENAHNYPLDERVATPTQCYTRAITINAPKSFVWAYLVQLGQERGGMYSYDWLENLAGCQMHTTDHVVSAWQTIEIGRTMRFGPKEKGFPLQKVIAYEWEHYLVFAGADPHTEVVNDPAIPETIAIGNITWGLYLEASSATTTRLISRSRLAYPLQASLVLLWRITEVLNLVMERKMMRTIKKLAERDFQQQKSF